MTTRPHDMSDLYLAPVVLELNHRLGEFEGLSHDEIELRVALETDREPRDRTDRADLVLLSLTHLLNTHGWIIDWVPRGLQIRHRDHQLVLGVPQSLRNYLDSGAR